MKKIIKEHEHFEKFMGYKAPEFKSDSGEFHVILWNLNYISNNKNEYAIGRLCLYLFINKSDDFILLVGMIPVNFCIPLKPGELLAHVFTAMRLYLADGFILIYLAIEIGKHFLVAHGSQGGEALVWIYAACFCLQTFVHHHQYTLVDAVVEFCSVAVQTYLDDAERALLLFDHMKRNGGDYLSSATVQKNKICMK